MTADTPNWTNCQLKITWEEGVFVLSLEWKVDEEMPGVEVSDARSVLQGLPLHFAESNCWAAAAAFIFRQKWLLAHTNSTPIYGFKWAHCACFCHCKHKACSTLQISRCREKIIIVPERSFYIIKLWTGFLQAENNFFTIHLDIYIKEKNNYDCILLPEIVLIIIFYYFSSSPPGDCFVSIWCNFMLYWKDANNTFYYKCHKIKITKSNLGLSHLTAVLLYLMVRDQHSRPRSLKRSLISSPLIIILLLGERQTDADGGVPKINANTQRPFYVFAREISREFSRASIAARRFSDETAAISKPHITHTLAAAHFAGRARASARCLAADNST